MIAQAPRQQRIRVELCAFRVPFGLRSELPNRLSRQLPLKHEYYSLLSYQSTYTYHRFLIWSPPQLAPLWLSSNARLAHLVEY